MSMIKIIEPVQANLTEEERLSAWSAIRAGGGNPSGYQFYYGPELRRRSFIAQLSNKDFWRKQREFTPRAEIKDWIEKNYPNFYQEMRDLASFAWLRQDDYLAVTDFLTILWDGRRAELSTLIGFEHLADYMTDRLGIPFGAEFGFRFSAARYSGDWQEDDRAIFEECLCGAEYDDYWESGLILHLDNFLADMVLIFRPEEAQDSGVMQSENGSGADVPENAPPSIEGVQP